ncbi:hypothetical protein ES708_26598 [subsurface metagenome]
MRSGPKTNNIPPRATAISAIVLVNSGFFSVQSPTLPIVSRNFSRKEVKTGTSFAASDILILSKVPLSWVNVSVNLAAASAASFPKIGANFSASAIISLSPSVPSSSIGNSVVPALPNIRCAKAALTEESSIAARAPASFINWSSGLKPWRSLIDTPRLFIASTEVDKPSSASYMVAAILLMAFSTSPRLAPPSSAAYLNLDSASVATPVRKDILWTSSPILAKSLTAFAATATMIPPKAVIAAPATRRPFAMLLTLVCRPPTCFLPFSMPSIFSLPCKSKMFT